MRKSLAVSLLAAFAICTLHAGNLVAAIIPPIGLGPGSQYQLIFATHDGIAATSSAISTYNTFVTNQAAQNSALPSTTWTAVVSTDTVNADVNAPNIKVAGSYLPVYNTQGVLVSSSANAGLYNSGGIVAAVAADQFGGTPASFVWTGSLPGGFEYISPNTRAPEGLGSASGFTAVGLDNTSTGTWLWSSSVGGPQSQAQPLYALSGVLTVPTPEPATITVLGSALSLLAGFRLLMRRRMAKQIA